MSRRKTPPVIRLEQTAARAPALHWRRFRFAANAGQDAWEWIDEWSAFPATTLDQLAQSSNAFISFRTAYQRLLGSPVFWQAFMTSQEIFIVDRYFDDACLRTLLHYSDEALHASNGPAQQRIVIYSGETAGFESIAARYVAEQRTLHWHNFQTLGLALKHNDKHGIHDRFALLDDSIWHFGATVAGMHHQLNAMSGPWLDVDSRFRRFCEHMEQVAQRRGGR